MDVLFCFWVKSDLGVGTHKERSHIGILLKQAEKLIYGKRQVSSDQNPGYSVCIVDYTIPSYIWIVISQYKDPVIKQSVLHGSCQPSGFC